MEIKTERAAAISASSSVFRNAFSIISSKVAVHFRRSGAIYRSVSRVLILLIAVRRMDALEWRAFYSGNKRKIGEKGIKLLFQQKMCKLLHSISSPYFLLVVLSRMSHSWSKGVTVSVTFSSSEMIVSLPEMTSVIIQNSILFKTRFYDNIKQQFNSE